MKDNEFIELLNLYLDHEISEADAARLEAEVQRSPARHAVYREYCRMHKACGLLSPAAVGEVPAAPVFEASPTRWANPFALGGGLLAAAACVTFLFLSRAPTVTPAPQGAAIAAETPKPSHSDAVAASSGSVISENRGQVVSVSLDRADFQAPLAIQTLRWNPNDLPTTSNARLNWLEKFELTALPPVPVDSLRLDVKPSPTNGGRPFDSGQAESPTEYNAIQFQR